MKRRRTRCMCGSIECLSSWCGEIYGQEPFETSSMFRVEVAESHPCVVSVLTFSQGFVHIWKWILESSVVCLWALSRVSSNDGGDRLSM